MRRVWVSAVRTGEHHSFNASIIHPVEAKRASRLYLDLDLIRIGFVTIISLSSSLSYREHYLVCADACVRFMRDGHVSSPSLSK